MIQKYICTILKYKTVCTIWLILFVTEKNILRKKTGRNHSNTVMLVVILGWLNYELNLFSF